jgi:tryptophanyl-tRNA synthetase
MTQFKEKSESTSENTNIGLFDYPVLMAADVLLYDAKFVPVGDDQDQHLELARALARRFNSRFGKTFIEPQALHTEVPRLMSLDDPKKKMSKSRPEGCLFLDDEPEVIRKKIKRAVTDSGSEIKFNEKEKPAISNLLLIYSAFSGKTIKQIEKLYVGNGYGEFKLDLAEVVIRGLTPFQKKKNELKKKFPQILKGVFVGNKKAKKVASKKMLEIKKKVGIQ